MNEETLIQQAQKGDVAAFNRLVVQYQELVFNVAYRIMGDPAAAEDVAQETFITAYRRQLQVVAHPRGHQSLLRRVAAAQAAAAVVAR